VRPVAYYTALELQTLAAETRAAWGAEHPHMFVPPTQSYRLVTYINGDANLVVSFKARPRGGSQYAVQNIAIDLSPGARDA